LSHPADNETLFRRKCARALELFTGITLPAIETCPSPESGFRFRAEFRLLKRENNAPGYAMHQPGRRDQLVAVTGFPIAASRIQELMPAVLEAIRAADELTRKLFYIEFLASTLGETLISLIYHRPLGDEWIESARRLKAALQADSAAPLHILGRSKGQKICLDQDFIHEQFTVAGTDYRYQQIEGSFTQPNAFINQQMLDWAASVTAGSNGDLLELYCGNGNFTLPLSKNFRKVLATEVSKTSIRSAEFNLSLNHIHNVAVVRLSSEETAQALNRVRPFRRLAHQNLDDYHFSTVLVDPPRAGLDEQTLKLVQQFDQICYISCNPLTLAANLHHLTQTHRIKRFAMFDQFPHTDHLECGIYLERSLRLRSGNDSVHSSSPSALPEVNPVEGNAVTGGDP
jgi:tRNA (uracil-5-)-methyltransferase